MTTEHDIQQLAYMYGWESGVQYERSSNADLFSTAGVARPCAALEGMRDAFNERDDLYDSYWKTYFKTEFDNWLESTGQTQESWYAREQGLLAAARARQARGK